MNAKKIPKKNDDIKFIIGWGNLLLEESIFREAKRNKIKICFYLVNPTYKGKKTFLLLPIGKGRLLNWSSENKNSIWYPSVNIFQQKNVGDWQLPINQIKKELHKFIEND